MTGMAPRNIKLVIQFDGTDFCGWQVQAGVRTVQGDLGAAIRRLAGADVTLHSSSRTDAGVHALAMPVSFRLETRLPLKAFTLGLNSLLAPDVRVISAEDAAPSFHARFSAVAKTYRYRVQNGRVCLPLERRTSWHVPVPLDPDLMRAAAAILVGEHDFSAFRAAHCDAVSPVRTVRRVSVVEARPGVMEVEIEADGFLRNMVRIVVGTIAQAGLRRRPPGWVGEVLEGRDRRSGGPTAPPQGLFLVDVKYPRPPPGG